MINRNFFDDKKECMRTCGRNVTESGEYEDDDELEDEDYSSEFDLASVQGGSVVKLSGTKEHINSFLN